MIGNLLTHFTPDEYCLISSGSYAQGAYDAAYHHLAAGQTFLSPFLRKLPGISLDKDTPFRRTFRPVLKLYKRLRGDYQLSDAERLVDALERDLRRIIQQEGCYALVACAAACPSRPWPRTAPARRPGSRSCRTSSITSAWRKPAGCGSTRCVTRRNRRAARPWSRPPRIHRGRLPAAARGGEHHRAHHVSRARSSRSWMLYLSARHRKVSTSSIPGQSTQPTTTPFATCWRPWSSSIGQTSRSTCSRLNCPSSCATPESRQQLPVHQHVDHAASCRHPTPGGRAVPGPGVNHPSGKSHLVAEQAGRISPVAPDPQCRR